MSTGQHGAPFDGWFPTNNTHEFEYFKQTVQMAAQGCTEQDILTAIAICRNAVKPEEGREKLMQCVMRRLGVSAHSESSAHGLPRTFLL